MFLQNARWFHATRAIGVLFLLYGLLSPDDPDRGTIILIGSGFIGGELVAKTDSVSGKKKADKDAA